MCEDPLERRRCIVENGIPSEFQVLTGVIGKRVLTPGDIGSEGSLAAKCLAGTRLLFFG